MSCEAATISITNIYQHPEIDQCICKLVEPEYRQDFKQELFLILLQIDCDTVAKMNGDLKFYVVRIILNLVRQQRNVFHKKYLDKTVEYNTDKINYEMSSPADIDTITERAEREQKEEETISRLNGIDLHLGNDNYPVYEKMIRLIADKGNMYRVSIATGIPNETIRRMVGKVRKHLEQ